MFRHIWRRIVNWFRGTSEPSPELVSNPVPAPVTPQIQESENVTADQTDLIEISPEVRFAAMVAIPGNPIHRGRAFAHTRRRIRERYSTPVYEFNLNQSLWEHWNHLIATNDPRALRLDTEYGPVWRVEHGPQMIYLAYDHGFVVTALPPNRKEFPLLVKRALEKRNRPPILLKDGKVSSKKVGKGVLTSPVKPKPQSKPIKKTFVPEAHQKLPPLHKRPQRNEALLRRLKNMEKKWEHD